MTPSGQSARTSPVRGPGAPSREQGTSRRPAQWPPEAPPPLLLCGCSEVVRALREARAGQVGLPHPLLFSGVGETHQSHARVCLEQGGKQLVSGKSAAGPCNAPRLAKAGSTFDFGLARTLFKSSESKKTNGCSLVMGARERAFGLFGRNMIPFNRSCVQILQFCFAPHRPGPV